jgi:hypothetical protein
MNTLYFTDGIAWELFKRWSLVSPCPATAAQQEKQRWRQQQLQPRQGRRKRQRTLFFTESLALKYCSVKHLQDLEVCSGKFVSCVLTNKSTVESHSIPSGRQGSRPLEDT